VLGSVLGQKGAGAAGVLNGILGGAKGQQPSTQQQQQANPINSIMDQFKKKKKPN
jgi:hypothetical protein